MSCVVLMNKTLNCCVVNSLDCYLVAIGCNSLVTCFDSCVELLQDGLESGLVGTVFFARSSLDLASLFIADLMLGIVAPPLTQLTGAELLSNRVTKKSITGFSGEYRRFSPAIGLSTAQSDRYCRLGLKIDNE